MTTIIEYALMAGASYRDTRPDDNNKFPIPAGWIMVSQNPQDDATGFEAAAFGNGTTLASSNEIVISFAGTDLRVWQDTNQDGISQSDELLTLADAGITGLGLTDTGTQIRSCHA
jgi:hypothetical protein